MHRAAIYARYSSANQREASIEDQTRECRARCDQEGWELVQVYADHGISGATTLRPSYQQLLEDMRRGHFDIIVTEALDRLSRDLENIAALFKRATFAGVRLFTLAEGEISDLHVGLSGTMNALFLKHLAQKTHRGLEGRVRQGKSAGGNSFGYDVVREIDEDGLPQKGGRSINEPQAVVVRRIFEDFSGGKSPRKIASDLNAEGVAGPGGRKWGDTTIRGHHTRRTGILRNELYVGRLIWNRQRYVKDPTTGKRLARPNPESEWIVRELPHLRIIDGDLWDSVQARLAEVRNSPRVSKARKTRFWEHRRPKHLLTGIATCGVCGGPLSSVGKDYLACSGARRKGICTNRRGIRRGLLEGLILEGLKSRLMAPDLVKEFVKAFHQEANRIAHASEQELTSKIRQLEQVVQKLDALIDAVSEGIRSESLQSKLDSLEAKKSALEAKPADAPPIPPRFHPNLAEIYRQKVQQLQNSLNDPSVRQEAIEILRGLIEKAVVLPIEDGFEIEIVGEIANMLEIPGGPDSTVPDVYPSSVKVVAGARNRLYLLVVATNLPIVAA